MIIGGRSRQEQGGQKRREKLSGGRKKDGMERRLFLLCCWWKAERGATPSPPTAFMSFQMFLPFYYLAMSFFVIQRRTFDPPSAIVSSLVPLISR